MSYRRLPDEPWAHGWRDVPFVDGPLEALHYHVPLDSEGRVPELLGRDELEELYIHGWPHGLSATGYKWSDEKGAYQFDEEPPGDAPGWEGGFAPNH